MKSPVFKTFDIARGPTLSSSLPLRKILKDQGVATQLLIQVYHMHSGDFQTDCHFFVEETFKNKIIEHPNLIGWNIVNHRF